jgi:hypothetical protein
MIHSGGGVSQDDRMSLMRHWLVFPGPEISQAAEIVTDAEDAAALAGAGHRVEGPFVPEPPQGAVSDLDAAVRLLNDARTTIIDRRNHAANHGERRHRGLLLGTNITKIPGGVRRADAIRDLLSEPYYIRLTRSGHPEHPLYLPASLEPEPWT